MSVRDAQVSELHSVSLPVIPSQDLEPGNDDLNTGRPNLSQAWPRPYHNKRTYMSEKQVTIAGSSLLQDP